MSETMNAKSSRLRNPVFWGLLLTAILGTIVAVLALTAGPSGEIRLAEFGSLASNEIGDTLAGIFAPLAFIWIVVTVFLQSQELAEQRRELALTREELRLAREAQEKQLGVMEIQATIFEDEKLRRDQDEERKAFNLRLHYLARDLLPLAGTLSHIRETTIPPHNQVTHRQEIILTNPQDPENADSVVRHFADQIQGEAMLLGSPPTTWKKFVALDGVAREGLQAIRTRAESIVNCEDKLSSTEKLRFAELRLGELASSLAYLCDRSDLWDWEKSGRTWVFAQ